MKLTTIVRRIHLWAGVILGIQVMLWMVSGVVMSWYHLDLVRGERNAPTVAPVELKAETYASPGGVIAQVDGAYSVELKTFLRRAVYEVHGVNGAALFDAQSGARISPIEDDQARILARNGFVGAGEIATLELVDNPGGEYRGSGPRPVWRAQFNDKLHTRLYISPETGEIVRRRNDIWRFYDFFWMLHIMDYEARENFTAPWLKAFSLFGLSFATSGLIMIFFRQGRNQLISDIRFLTGRRSKKKTPAV